MAEPQVIWQNTVDHGKWRVRVIRSGPYTGILQIRRDDKLVHVEGVGLAYGALFGPDIADVEEWQERAIEVIDSFAEASDAE